MSHAKTKRPRGANIRSLFDAATKKGLQVTGAIIRDDGVELKFAPGDSTAASPAANPWDQDLAKA
jgi:hypothetical protein